MALVILLSALVGGLLTGLFFLLHRSKKTADTAENAMAAQALHGHSCAFRIMPLAKC